VLPLVHHPSKISTSTRKALAEFLPVNELSFRQ
jgi:hypothetical protein